MTHSAGFVPSTSKETLQSGPQIGFQEGSAMERHCRLVPPEELLTGIELFNSGRYFECHDILEELWQNTAGTIRSLYKGVLQIGVALYHQRHGNLSGAVKLLKSGVDLLRPFAPVCLGMDVTSLINGAISVRQFLEVSSGTTPLPPEIIPHIRFVHENSPQPN